MHPPLPLSPQKSLWICPLYHDHHHRLRHLGSPFPHSPILHAPIPCLPIPRLPIRLQLLEANNNNNNDQCESLTVRSRILGLFEAICHLEMLDQLDVSATAPVLMSRPHLQISVRHTFWHCSAGVSVSAIVLSWGGGGGGGGGGL